MTADDGFRRLREAPSLEERRRRAESAALTGDDVIRERQGRLKSALHEAGHAIAALESGCGVEAVTLGTHFNAGRVAWASGAMIPKSIRSKRAEAQIAVAGPLAAHLAGVAWAAGDGGGDDVARATACLSADELRAVVDETAALLARRWRDLEVIADELVIRGRLSGDEVNALLLEDRAAVAAL